MTTMTRPVGFLRKNSCSTWLVAPRGPPTQRRWLDHTPGEWSLSASDELNVPSRKDVISDVRLGKHPDQTRAKGEDWWWGKGESAAQDTNSDQHQKTRRDENWEEVDTGFCLYHMGTHRIKVNIMMNCGGLMYWYFIWHYCCFLCIWHLGCCLYHWGTHCIKVNMD